MPTHEQSASTLAILPSRKNPHYQSDKRLGGPQGQSGFNGKVKNLCPSQESNSSCSACHYTDYHCPFMVQSEFPNFHLTDSTPGTSTDGGAVKRKTYYTVQTA